jgi:pyrroline-5-carboxylate reductase
MKTPKIAFIGGGNMARALIGGLRNAGYPAQQIRVADPGAAARERVAAQFGVEVTSENRTAVNGCETVVLAVKPQVMPDVLGDLKETLAPETLVISVAAGVTLKTLRAGLGDRVQLVRAMPNTPALYGAGMTGMVAADGLNTDAAGRAEAILKSAGEVVWLDDEALMDVVTAVSGSGPAYFFALAERLAEAGERAGLDPDVAARLASQTARGAGVMLTESGEPAGRLREQVTSPGGTTAAALSVLEAADFAQLVDDAVTAAVRRGRELGGN